MNFSAWILKIFGWKTIYRIEEPIKSVICVAPHTSNWDFVVGKLGYSALKRKTCFLMKKSWFVFPLGYFFSAMGGIPIDRSRRMSVTQQMVEEFEQRENFHLAITPEGTRKPNKEWKKGFYYIAKGAGVPIELAYLDFENKEMGITEVFYPTQDEEADLKHIYNFYRRVKGKKPQNFIIPE